MSDLYLAGPASEPLTGSDTTYLYTTWATREALLARGVEPERLWDGITADSGAALDRFVLECATRWYRRGERDITEFDGMSLGGIHEWMAWFTTFIPVYKLVAAMQAWLTRCRPEKIWLDTVLDAHFPQALEQIRQAYAPIATLQLINSNSVAGNALRPWRPQTLYRKHYLAAILWNNLARSLQLLSPRHGQAAHVLCFNYHTIEPVLKGMLDAPDRFRVSLADRPSSHQRAYALRRGANLLLPDRAPLTTLDWQRVHEIQTEWHELVERNDFRQQFRWNEIDVWPALHNDLAQIIDVALPRTAALAKGYRLTLERARPNCILLPFDSAYLHQTVIEAARQLNIPTVVMLHGLPGVYHRGGCSLRSDYLLVWGAAIAERFVSAGRHAEQIHQIGFPSTSPTQTGARRTTAAEKTVLLLTNPFGNGTTLSAEDDAETYLFNILGEIQQLPDLQVLLRPHPSESADYYQHLATAGKFKNIRLTPTEPIAELLSRADLVIGPISTVLIDALVAQVPVLCVNFSKVQYPAPFDGQWEVPLITSVEALHEHLDRFQTAPLPLPPDALIDQFCGACDGQTLPRILTAIEQIAQRQP